MPLVSSEMIFTAEKISRRIDDRWVLRDLSFKTTTGDVFGVLGRNDSGKTLLLKILAGLETPDTGSVELEGSEGQPGSAVYVPGMDGPGGGLFRKPRLESSAERIERITGALETTNAVTLLDGVFDGLDPENAAKIRRLIHERAALNNSIYIIAGSDRRQIYLTCNRLGILHGGEFIQTGTPEEVYRTPETALAAELTGYVNLIPARRMSSSKKEEHEFVTIEGEHRLRTGNTEKGSLSPIDQNILLCIRPEEISISFGASFPEDNLLKATVTDVAFLGPVTKIGLDSNGLRLESLVLRLVGLNPGDECMVGLPPDRIRLLKG